MDFEELYRKELDKVKHNKDTDKKILNMIEIDKNNKMAKMERCYSHRGRILVVAAMAIMCIVAVTFNYDAVATYAESLFGTFGLNAGKEKIQFDEITPINLDYERYLTDENADRKGGLYYYSYDSFYEGLGIELPGAESIEFNWISISVNWEYNVGNISAVFNYADEEYHMNGRFIIDGYVYEGLGYGEREDAYYVYEYAERKKAYFVSSNEKGENQRVYFSEGGFIFQLMVEDSEEGTIKAKRIIDNMTK